MFRRRPAAAQPFGAAGRRAWRKEARNMPRPLRALAFVLVAAIAATRAGRAATLEERFEHVYPLPSGGTFALGNVNGDVAIAPWNRAEVRVPAVKRVKAGSQAGA